MQEMRQVTVRLPAELFREAKKRMVDEDTTFQEVGEKLFREWMEGHGTPVAGSKKAKGK